MIQTDEMAPYRNEKKYEGSLLDFFINLFKHKWMIVSVVLAVGIVTLLVTKLFLPVLYQSQCVLITRQDIDRVGRADIYSFELGPMKPESGGSYSLSGGSQPFISDFYKVISADELVTILKSRELAIATIKGKNLLPEILHNVWQKNEKDWTSNDDATLDEIFLLLNKRLNGKIEKDNFIKITYEDTDPKNAKKVLDCFLKTLSETVRQRTLGEIFRSRTKLAALLQSTKDTHHKMKIETILARYTEIETFVNAQDYFGFHVLDPPFVPIKKTKPRTLLICLISVTIAFFTAVLAAFFIEYICELKVSEPDKYEKLKGYMRLRNKRASQDLRG